MKKEEADKLPHVADRLLYLLTEAYAGLRVSAERAHAGCEMVVLKHHLTDPDVRALFDLLERVRRSDKFEEQKSMAQGLLVYRDGKCHCGTPPCLPPLREPYYLDPGLSGVLSSTEENTDAAKDG